MNSGGEGERGAEDASAAGDGRGPVVAAVGAVNNLMLAMLLLQVFQCTF